MKINDLPESTNILFQRVRRAVLWAVVMALGMLLWFCGLAMLGVSPDLPQWRYGAGAALMATACFLWWRA